MSRRWTPTWKRDAERPSRGRRRGQGGSVDRRPRAQRALIVHPQRSRAAGLRSVEARLEEAAGLARALDLEVVETLAVPLRSPTPATLFGSGRVEMLHAAADADKADVMIVDDALSPVQQRNLEKACDVKVIDRTGLILEIFGRRARTREGRLQVELARLAYERSRLVRTWTHLERQSGGFGRTGGPGETQIELDRRQIADRIAKLKLELEEVRRTRTLHREARQRAPFPTIALVGYTNAGKSTLFNRLTDATVEAKDMLFATLDPTLRAVALPGGRRAILSDTVGFISDLPHELVAAFRATLEEVLQADVILHVRDISAESSDAEAEDVLTVLADPRRLVPRSPAFWRSGTRPTFWTPRRWRCSRPRRAARDVPPALVSALTGQGSGRATRYARPAHGHGPPPVEVRLAAGDGQRPGLALRPRPGRGIGTTGRAALSHADRAAGREGARPVPPRLSHCGK